MNILTRICLSAILSCGSLAALAQQGTPGGIAVPGNGTVGPGAKPDLIVTDFAITFYSVNGVKYRYTVKNVGNIAANVTKVSVKALWDADDTFRNPAPGGGALISANHPIDKLMPGATMSGTFSFSFPNTNYSQYHLVSLQVDAGNAVEESNEKNNFKVIGH